MSDRTLLVTGASGRLGRRVVELLVAARSADTLIATTRDPAKLAELGDQRVIVRHADFDDDVDAIANAFAGAERVLLVSTDAMDAPEHRTRHNVRAIEAAKKAAVKHVVYTSLADPSEESPLTLAVVHRQTEAALAASGLGYTSLRFNQYTDNLLFALPPAVAAGELRSAVGDAGIAYITREDCAQVAAQVLLAKTPPSGVIDVSGPEAVTPAQLVEAVVAATGRPLAYVPLTVDQLRAGLLAAGYPTAVIELLASLDAAAAQGRFATVTPAAAEWLGRKPTSVAEFLAANRDAIAGA